MVYLAVSVAQTIYFEIVGLLAINKLERMRKKAVVAYLKYLQGIYMAGLNKNAKDLSPDNWSSG
jgi:hypothetical protein